MENLTEKPRTSRVVTEALLPATVEKPTTTRGVDAGILQERRLRQFGVRFVALEIAVSNVSARMDDAFANSFEVKGSDLLTQNEFFKQLWSTAPDGERFLTVCKRNALVGRQSTRPEVVG